MSTINTTKVIIGGLVAGLVFNVIDFIVNSYLLAAEFAANATRLGLDPATMNSSTTLVTVVVVDFLIGIVAVYLYAAIRPRFGPGPKTATIAALLFVIPVTLVLFIFTNLGVFDMAFFAKGTAYSFLNSIVGTIAGAKFYSEAA